MTKPNDKLFSGGSYAICHLRDYFKWHSQEYSLLDALVLSILPSQSFLILEIGIDLLYPAISFYTFAIYSLKIEANIKQAKWT